MITATEKIKEIRPKDFHTVINIISESKLIDEQLLDLENAIVFIKNKLERNRAKIFIKTNNSIPVAFMVLYYKISTKSTLKYNWHISYLYVKPEFRRKKIGVEIMEKCIDYAKKTKVEHISLNTDTKNYPAQQLYENFGFIRKNFIADYYYYEMTLIY